MSKLSRGLTYILHFAASTPVRFASARRPLLQSAIRQYSAATPTGTVTVHKRSKWKMFKRTVQFGLLAGIGYSAYGKRSMRNNEPDIS